mgnify:CR=1 FL=1
MARPGARVHEQRRHLPDGPGVYLFHDAKGKVIYVGKAKSLKKRVASHFSNPVTRGAYRMTEEIESVDYLLVASESEALLVEQNFHFAATVADRHYVVEHGQVVDMIENDQIAANKNKLEAYLGV